MAIAQHAPIAFEYRSYLDRPSCPRCGAFIHTAEGADFQSDGCVRHFWSCEECGEAFLTSVSFSTRFE
jgi:hypothetical protein